jgi:hypothetical protein
MGSVPRGVAVSWLASVRIVGDRREQYRYGHASRDWWAARVAAGLLVELRALTAERDRLLGVLDAKDDDLAGLRLELALVRRQQGMPAYSAEPFGAEPFDPEPEPPLDPDVTELSPAASPRWSRAFTGRVRA